MPPDSALKRLATSFRTPGGWIVAGLEFAQQSSGAGRYDPGWIHPSDLGNDCDAFLAFRYLGAPAVQEISAQTRRVFDLGSGRDEYLKRDMQNAGLSLINKEEDRQIVIPNLHIRGELDDWLENPTTKRKAVIDFKTMRPDEWELLKAVKRGHHLQLHPYMFDKETYEGFVLYENKGDQRLKILQADFDDRIWKEEIVDRLERIYTGLEHDVVYRNPVSCNRCPFFKNAVCTSNKIAELREKSGLWKSSL